MKAASCSVRIFAVIVVAHGFGSTVAAIDVEITGQTIAIPAPVGFSEIGKIAPDTFNLFKASLPDNIPLIAAFVSEADVGRLIRDERPVLDRYMLAQSIMEELTLSESMFAELRAAMRKQYGATPLDSNSINESLKKVGARLSEKAGAAFNVTLDRHVLLGIDAETATSISASMLVKTMISSGGESTERIFAGSQTVLLAKGRAIQLCVYRSYYGQKDLDWTRKQSQDWLKAILATNETTSPVADGDISPPGVAVAATAKTLLSGEWQEYNLKDHPKAQNLDVTLRLPQAWKAEEGERPHIVQKFSGKIQGGISPFCSVFVQSMPPWAGLLLQGEIGGAVLAENLKDMLPAGALLIDSGQTKLDGEPGVWLKYSYELESNGSRWRMYMLQYMVPCRGRMIVLNCGVKGFADDDALKDAFASHQPVFQMIANSLIINEKWTANSSKSFGSLMADAFGPYWQLALLLVGVLTLGMGLLAPLLIRFVLLRHPIARGSAIFYTVNFLIFNAPIALFTGYDRLLETWGALLVTGFVPYGILRRGTDKYEQEWTKQTHKDSPQSPARESAAVLSDLLHEEGQKQPPTNPDERYMPPEMREKPAAIKPITDYVQHELRNTIDGGGKMNSPSKSEMPRSSTIRDEPPVIPSSPLWPSPASTDDGRYMPPEMRSQGAMMAEMVPLGMLAEAARMADVGTIANNDSVSEESGHSLVESPCEPSDGGIGRLGYVLSMFGLAILNVFIGAAAGPNPGLVSIVSILELAVVLPLVIARLHNIGMSGWWAVLIFIPIANLAVGVPCLIYPPGYSHTKQLDAAAKVLICLFIAVVVLIMVGVFAEA